MTMPNLLHQRVSGVLRLERATHPLPRGGTDLTPKIAPLRGLLHRFGIWQLVNRAGRR